MSEVWRIFVVEGDENLNRNIVSSLRKDGYEVQGVLSGADAVRVLWSEEYDLVICDLKTPAAEGIELLQWLRAYRPNIRMILVGEAAGESGDMRMQALESGADSYLEKPLDLHLLKEELRRLLQQTGFSANLDSFDLLDVIQIITLSRKSIALLVNTGLEERGLLGFKDGELIWAEYGILRGEEAFFALAAHKNGTVMHQPWNNQITSNVTQPLSRLIFQALQYRTKYANQPQLTGEQEAISSSSSLTDEIDDRPFAFFDDLEQEAQKRAGQEWGMPQGQNGQHIQHIEDENNKEWWEKTGSMPEIKRTTTPPVTHKLSEEEMNGSSLARALQGLDNTLVSTDGQGVANAARADLPSWLTEQPAPLTTNMLASDAAPFREAPIMPLSPASAPEWAALPKEMLSGLAQSASGPVPQVASGQTMRRSSPTWERPENGFANQESAQSFVPPSIPTNPVVPMQTVSKGSGDAFTLSKGQGRQPDQAVQASEASQPLQAVGAQRSTRRHYNYASLVAALQTLGYAIPGFESAAIVSMEGQPIAQVSIDDQDLSLLCKQLSQLLKNALQIHPDEEGAFEDLVVQSKKKRTILRLIGQERNAFLMLITARDADLSVSREIILNIEDAISTALRG